MVTTWIEPENSDGCASRSLIAMAGCWPEVTACWICCASDVVVAVTEPSPSSLVLDQERQVVAHEGRVHDRRRGVLVRAVREIVAGVSGEICVGDAEHLLGPSLLFFGQQRWEDRFLQRRHVRFVEERGAHPAGLADD